MDISKNLKIGAVVISGIALAFIAGYVIFSYFSHNSNNVKLAEDTQTNNAPTPNIENDGKGITSNGSVAGASTNDGSGISDSPRADSSINMQNAEKGGVLGETTTYTQNGIAPNNATPQKVTITSADRANYITKSNNTSTHYEYTDDNNDDSEVSLYKNPEIDEEDDYVQYTYTFTFNSDARDRYSDGFTYKIDPQTCDSDKYFTSGKYDFSGTINSDDMDKNVEIKVRIKDQYIDDSNDFDDSDYKLDGTNYTVRGDINVPHCEN